MKEVTKVITLVSVFFLALYTANAAYQNIAMVIFEEEGDDQIVPFLFIINYTTLMIASLFTPLIKKS